MGIVAPHDTLSISLRQTDTFKRLRPDAGSPRPSMLYQLTVKRWIINIGASLGATDGIFAAGNAVAGQGGSARAAWQRVIDRWNWGAISGWARAAG